MPNVEEFDSFEFILRHLTGGIDLAAEWAGFTTVGQCEWADYPTKVLEKHWPDVPRWRDVHDLTGDDVRRGCGEITLLSGGFPCQPHSLAGKRKASGDERDLWPEYRRLISEIKPEWVLAENVRGLLSSENGRFFRGVLRDLADLGYDAGWCTYPASWVGAVHRRERVFTLAHANSIRRYGVGKEAKNKYKTSLMEILEGAKAGQVYSSLYVQWPFRKPDSGSVRNDYGIETSLYRLRCLGNMVMPQQVYPILAAIAEIEQSHPAAGRENRKEQNNEKV